MHDRPVYCGNFDYETTPKEVEKLFEKYGDVDRVEMKTGKPPLKSWMVLMHDTCFCKFVVTCPFKDVESFVPSQVVDVTAPTS